MKTIRLAAVALAFDKHLSAVRWQRHCASRGYPLHGAVESARASARYDRLRDFIARRDGIAISAGQPMNP